MIEQNNEMWAAYEKLNEKLEEKQAPYEPKEGDYMYVLTHEGEDAIAIRAKGFEKTTSYAHLHKYGVMKLYFKTRYFCFNSDISIIRPATPKEKQLLDDKLKEQGKRWNAEKKVIEDIPTWKIGDWFIPHKPKVNNIEPIWVGGMDCYDGKPLKVFSVFQGTITANGYCFQFDWCEKTEEPKKEPKIGDMCIFWDDNKRNALIRLFNMKTPYEYIDSTGTDWGNCIPFESVEQYKNFIENE